MKYVIVKFKSGKTVHIDWLSGERLVWEAGNTGAVPCYTEWLECR